MKMAIEKLYKMDVEDTKKVEDQTNIFLYRDAANVDFISLPFTIFSTRIRPSQKKLRLNWGL